MNNKKLKICMIVLLSILAIALIVIMIIGMSKDFKFSNIFSNINVSTELIYDETYENTFEKINISSTTGDIYIKESKDDQVQVIIYGTKDTTSLEKTEKELNIKISTKPCIGICFNSTISKIEVYLPSTYENKIEIDNDYGDIEVGDFINASLDISEDSGDIKIGEVKYLKAENSYGDIKVAQAIEADITVSAGDAEIEKVDSISINNSYGDIKIDSVTNYLDVNNDCGDIIIGDVILNKDSTINNSFGDIKIGHTNEINIEASTELGNVEVRNNYKDSTIRLTVKNDCGDIEISN